MTTATPTELDPVRLRAASTCQTLHWLASGRIDAAQLVQPYFVVPGEGVRREIGSMPGQYQLSIDELGPLFGVHRATVARWLAQAKERVSTRTLQALVPLGVSVHPSLLDEAVNAGLSRLLASTAG